MAPLDYAQGVSRLHQPFRDVISGDQNLMEDHEDTSRRTHYDFFHAAQLLETSDQPSPAMGLGKAVDELKLDAMRAMSEAHWQYALSPEK